jgi:nicotinate phosphoribosyltransferase
MARLQPTLLPAMIQRCPLLLDGRALLDADGLLRAGLAERRASFELSFDELPKDVGFVVVAGIETFLDSLYRLVIDEAQLEAAARLCGISDRLKRWLLRLAPSADVDAMPDGTLAFARMPVATVEGPFIEAIIIGALLRATVQRATAVATRAARLHIASAGDPLIDGSSAISASVDGSLAEARWAHVGGASATDNALAAISLGIPFRCSPGIKLDSLASTPPPGLSDGWDASPAGGWDALPAESLFDLGGGDDEEAALLEAKRVKVKAGGFVARGLASAGALSTRYELVALELGGAWCPMRGPGNDADVVPGRKRVVRYTDAASRAIADVIHLTTERMCSPSDLGAQTLAPLARAFMRDGRMLEAPELPALGRERSIAARPGLPPEVTHLRRPGSYRVELSEGLGALRDAI